MQSQKRQNDLCSFVQGRPFNITVIQVYDPASNAEEAKGERFYEDLQDLLEYPKKQCAVVDVTGDGSKIPCCKEQYFTGIWNIKSRHHGKLDMVKYEMARLNIDILGISELKWTGMGKFNSDDHYIYYCGQESLRRNGVALIVNKRVRNAVLHAISKTTEGSLFVSKANHSISQ